MATMGTRKLTFQKSPVQSGELHPQVATQAVNLTITHIHVQAVATFQISQVGFGSPIMREGLPPGLGTPIMPEGFTTETGLMLASPKI